LEYCIKCSDIIEDNICGDCLNVLKQFGSFNISENKIIGVEATKVVGFCTSTLAILILIILFAETLKFSKKKSSLLKKI